MHAADGGLIAAQPGVSPLELGRRAAPLVAGYAMPFLLVFYLAMKGGGYDAVVRSQVGIAVWWIVLLGAVVGALPVARVNRSAWAMFGLLAAFCAWTALSIGWSESSERSATELARVGVYLGVFALALTAQGREGLRRAVYSIGAAIAVVAVLALLSRLHPAWFPEATGGALGARNRLSYPLHYWNGLAALIAIGVPLLLLIATSARHTATRALAAAAMPAVCLAGFYTLSRGGVFELAVALVVLIALHPRRLSLLPTLVVAGIGAGLTIAAATQRNALVEGLTDHTAAAQADEMLAIVLVSAVAVGLVQVAIALCARYQLGPRPRVSRSTALVATITAATGVLVVAIAAGLPGELSDRWQEFKDPNAAPQSANAQRLESANGNGRYQLWQSALDANATEPITGIGPGTFEFWWSREKTSSAFVRDAHSLYLETLAELGIVGLLLLGGLVVFVLSSGVVRALRAEPDQRALLAAATAACFAFATAAAVDWVWELAVLPVVFLLLAAAIVAPSANADASEIAESSSPLRRLGLIALAVAAIVAVAIPLASTSSVRASQDSANTGQLDTSLAKAQTAHSIQPYAATPNLQTALVLELAGDLDGAAAAATQATKDEPTNWRTWLVLSRLEAERGKVNQSIAAYREARSLNPMSALFQ